MNLRLANLRLQVAAKCVVPAIFFGLLPVPTSHAEDQPKASVVASAAAVAHRIGAGAVPLRDSVLKL